jgi:hypothetical protein
MINGLLANAVLLVNQQLEVSAFQQLWFVENNIVGKEEFLPNAFFSPVATVVSTTEFELLILPERVQFSAKQVESDPSAVFKDRFGRFLSAANLACTAVGFNFVFALKEMAGQRPYAEQAKAIFLSEHNPVKNDFSVDGADVGLFLSKPFEDGRLQIDIKPGQDASANKLLICSVNFHFETKTAKDALPKLEKVRAFWLEAQRLTQGFDTALASH